MQSRMRIFILLICHQVHYDLRLMSMPENEYGNSVSETEKREKSLKKRPISTPRCGTANQRRGYTIMLTEFTNSKQRSVAGRLLVFPSRSEKVKRYGVGN